MELEAIKERIESGIEGAFAEVRDLVGGGSHIHALVIAEVFHNKSLMVQHQIVMDLFKEEIEKNEVHALSLKTLTPEQAKEKGIVAGV